MSSRRPTNKEQRRIEAALFPYEGNYGITNYSYLGVRPGDLVILDYNFSYRIGLVVASMRTQTGIFISTRNNNLMNIFLIDSLSEALFTIVVNNLYENENSCSYYKAPSVLKGIIGKSNFRTLNVTHIQNLKRVFINIEKFRRRRRR